MENFRTETSVSMPEMALVAGTRMMFGAGLALLLSDRLTPEQRKATGWSLFTIGVMTAIPLTFQIFGNRRISSVQTFEPFESERAA